MKPEEWMDDAACAEVTPDIFFPEIGTNFTADAKKICAGCRVREVCLEYALDNELVFGIWGGTNPQDRKRIRRARR